jgi:class 3 adenylate cyclase
MIHGYEELTRIKRKRLTVFFSDIRGFTALSDEIEPEETVDLLKHYLSEMTELIHEYEGTLDKFMGDGIMVFFGDPVDQEDHAARAVRMAVAMQKRMGELQAQWGKTGRKPLSIGIGINTGYVTVGGIGSEHHLDYTVIGNQVNLAARLESVAAGGEIIISHATCGEVGELVEVEDRGEVTVKGLARPVKIYRVEGLHLTAGRSS